MFLEGCYYEFRAEMFFREFWFRQVFIVRSGLFTEIASGRRLWAMVLTKLGDRPDKIGARAVMTLTLVKLERYPAQRLQELCNYRHSGGGMRRGERMMAPLQRQMQIDEADRASVATGVPMNRAASEGRATSVTRGNSETRASSSTGWGRGEGQGEGQGGGWRPSASSSSTPWSGSNWWDSNWR